MTSGNAKIGSQPDPLTPAEIVIQRLQGYYGQVQPALDFRNIYELTIAVVLSAQTTDRQVNQVTPKLFARYPNFNELANAGISDVEEIIHSTGFFHSKARNITGLARMVRDDFSGKLPSTMDELVKLPGVGRKSANVILSHGFNLPGLAVDTHVKRVAGRLGLTRSADPTKIEKDLCDALPAGIWGEAHLLLIVHGRTLCDARKPLCAKCPLTDICKYYANIIP